MACASDGGGDGHFPSQTREYLPTLTRVHPKQAASKTRQDPWRVVHEEWLEQCAWLGPTESFLQREGLNHKLEYWILS